MFHNMKILFKKYEQVIGFICTVLFLVFIFNYGNKYRNEILLYAKYTVGTVLNPTSSLDHKYMYMVDGVKYYGTVRERVNFQKRNYIKYGDKFWVVYSFKNPKKSYLLKHRKYTENTKFPDKVIKEDLTWFRIFSY